MALTKVDLANTVEGTLPVANGGTGATTQAAAAANVLPTQTGNSGKYLTTDGTNTSWGTVTSNPGTVTSITAGTGLSGGTITSSGTIALANTAVTAGSYTNASVTVDAQGRLTAASSGTAPVTSVSAGTGISVSGTTTPTITNTGVTSVTAGSGISVSASTGGITISTSGAGGVTSVNGQTGAVSTVTALAIGSTVTAFYAINAPAGTANNQYAAGTTASGSNLRYGVQGNWTAGIGYYINFPTNVSRQVNGGAQSLAFTGDYTSGSSLSGSWVAFTPINVAGYYQGATSKDPARQSALWSNGLWARYA